MTTMTELTVDQLSDLYAKVAHDDEARRIVESELERRERAEKARRAYAEDRAEWENAAYAQYLDAERECRGVLVRRGSPVADGWALWSGSEKWAQANCSEELHNYWLDHPRVTVTAYKQQIADGKRIQRDERDAQHEDQTGEDTVNPLGAAGHIAGRAAETVARETVYAQRRQAVTARAQEMAGQLHAQIAVRGSAAFVKTREPIDGAETLRYIYTFLKRFAVWGSDAEIVAATLWVAQTHARDGKGMPIWQYCARLLITGPSGSGKSWKSRLIGKLSYKGKILVEPTKPAFIDLCAENHTVIITEADEAFRSPGRARGIVAVINASYEPDRESSRKQGGVAVSIPLFCQLVLDGIDKVMLSPNRPDLLAMTSRCIVIIARKAKNGYRPPRFDARARAMAELVSQRASAWMAQEVEDGLADEVPPVPEHLGNRPFALWESLFAVALRADKGDPEGPWSGACRAACEELEGSFGVAEPDEESLDELDRQMAEWGSGPVAGEISEEE
jgi:Protein of unknown function (DUF3631)